MKPYQYGDVACDLFRHTQTIFDGICTTPKVGGVNMI